MTTYDKTQTELSATNTVKIAGLSTILLAMCSYIFQSLGGYAVGTVSAMYIFALILLGAFVLCDFKWARIVSLIMSVLLIPYTAYFLLIAVVMGGYKTGHDLQSISTIVIVFMALAFAVIGSVAYWRLVRTDFKTK